VCALVPGAAVRLTGSLVKEAAGAAGSPLVTLRRPRPAPSAPPPARHAVAGRTATAPVTATREVRAPEGVADLSSSSASR